MRRFSIRIYSITNGEFIREIAFRAHHPSEIDQYAQSLIEDGGKVYMIVEIPFEYWAIHEN